MGRLKSKSDYEEIRNARISENQARLATLGLQKTISELRALTSSPKSHIRKRCKVDYSSSPLRRSDRLRGKSPPPSQVEPEYLEDKNNSGDGKRKRHVNGHDKISDTMRQISLEALARRCESKGRGSLYDPVYGLCCHFCSGVQPPIRVYQRRKKRQAAA
ncbi:hypothetical protein OROHE_007737 [Orobanche hederae]